MKYKVKYFDDEKSTNTLYEMENLNKKDKYSVFLGGNHDLVIINTDLKDKNKKLLIIKDSYAHSLVPFLTNHYDEIHMVDLRYFNDNIDEYKKKNNIKNVLILYNGLSFAREQTISKLQTT